VYIVCFIDIAV